MTTKLRSYSDTWSRITGRQDISASKQSPVASRLPVEVGDRAIEMYLLQPANPSAELEALYSAIRHQMAIDGCV